MIYHPAIDKTWQRGNFSHTALANLFEEGMRFGQAKQINALKVIAEYPIHPANMDAVNMQRIAREGIK